MSHPRLHVFAFAALGVALFARPASALIEDGSGCPGEPGAPQGLELLDGVFAAAAAVPEIVGGAPHAGDPAVVAIVYADDSEAYCTGTLIAPRVVLTAAHCLDFTSTAEFRVFFGNDARRGTSGEGRTLRVASMLLHPGFDGKANDIALVRLTEDAPAEPVPMIAPGQTGRLVGERLRLVGFGRPSRDTAGGRKVMGWGRVDGVERTTLTHVPDPSATCTGDSGGPGFATVGGREVLAAVHIRGTCGGSSTKTRVDRYLDEFITPFVRGEIDGRSGVPAPPAPRPAAVPPVPAPASIDPVPSVPDVEPPDVHAPTGYGTPGTPAEVMEWWIEDARRRHPDWDVFVTPETL